MTETEIIDLYEKYQADNNMQLPKFADVKMYWEDEGPEDTRNDTIALTEFDINEDADDYILFYADGLKGLLALTKKNNGSDFVVTSVLEFY